MNYSYMKRQTFSKFQISKKVSLESIRNNIIIKIIIAFEIERQAITETTGKY